jgi:outer membrane protein OmpU
MKKILIATTALVATAGVASAELTLSGYARFGMLYNEGATSGFDAGETTTTSRFRVQMDASTETDGGVKLSVTSRFEANGGGQSSLNAPRFSVSSSGLSVSLGNICGAIECMPGVYTGGQKSAGIGLSGLGYNNMVVNTGSYAGDSLGTAAAAANYFNWDAYSSSGQGAAGRNGVELTYAMGDFKAHISYSDRNAVTAIAPTPGSVGRAAATANTTLAGFVAYTFSGWTAAVGFQDADIASQDKTIVTLGGAIGDVKLTAGYADNNGVDKYALAAAYALNSGLSLHGFVAVEDGNTGAASIYDGESYGVGVSYNLGAGASIEAGIAQASDGVTKADLGLHFSF